jgi:23S rRNA G2069 N7-methylase RlmK/C1962 C5-methylase RlmI
VTNEHDWRPPSRAFDDATIARHAEMLVNRVKKTQRKLGARMAREKLGAYRLYDRDIPEVRVSVDWYEGHLVVVEYEREQTGEAYLPELARVLGVALGLPDAHVHARRRRARALSRQRQDRATGPATRLVVGERAVRFAVRLSGEADVGLFPALRELRALVRAESAGKRVLDLFAYTGTFGVCAALGGADEVTFVDPSQLHLDWAAENLALNGLDAARHPLLRDDVRAFLGDAGESAERWDLAILDASSFAVRLGPDGAPLDVLRDHRALVGEALAVLEPGGVLWFLASHQRFVPDLEGLRAAECVERTAALIPDDYRNGEIHRVWRLVR